MNAAVLAGFNWSAPVKTALLIAASVLFLAALTFLIVELVGKKRTSALLVSEEIAVPVPVQALVTAEENSVVEDTIEETLVEEISEPETPAEEAFVEEISEPETPAEEAPAEEETPTPEAPTSENEDDDEGLAVAAIAITDAVMIEEDVTIPAESFIVDGKAIFVRYNRSFTARLSQSSAEVKERYDIIKNVLLSHKTKARTSWTNETFKQAKDVVAKFGIKGKTLSIYLALDPADYEGSKYFAENAGDTRRYEQVPLRMKLRSDRSVKWSIELIEELMAKRGVEKSVTATESYAPAHETTEALVHQGLIKVYTNGELGETAVSAADFETMRREKFRQVTGLGFMDSITPDEAEKALTNELAASFIEDESVLEEFTAEPITLILEAVEADADASEPLLTAEESATNAETNSATEADETTDEDNNSPSATEEAMADCAEPKQSGEEPEETEASEAPDATAANATAAPAEIQASITEPTATKVTENSKAAPKASKPAVTANEPIRVKRTAKKSVKHICNIDTISENFEAGDIVNLRALKDKGLIPKKAPSVKILARGVLNKPLTVVADVYSMQAVKMILLTGGRVIEKH